MIRLARAQPGIAVLSFDLRCATSLLPVATGRHVSSPFDRFPNKAFNAARQQTASAEIHIASDARPLHTFRGFLPWRFAYAGPRHPWRRHHGPASENLHRSGHSSALARPRNGCAGAERGAYCIDIGETFSRHEPVGDCKRGRLVMSICDRPGRSRVFLLDDFRARKIMYWSPLCPQ